ncbi:Panacea domain-containing protein [Pantoea vagans]|uniref:Panacea domain-containing protein n=1 Tax=Pantoea vagans TaxID=470934 RepID=UPI001093D64E|nr:type II toxin-antitoxin system antitoxin SocA domain-containing protein [Pantoea vagans]QCA04854.1 DUF4065 domain-containing protein [Pantoea vagans]
MAYSAIAVANAFIERAKEGKIPDLTPMKVQKLLFYTQSWYARLYDGEQLIDDSFARWKFGPVITSLYHDLKAYGYRPVTEKISRAVLAPGGKGVSLITPEVGADDKVANAMIDKIVEVYGRYTGNQLSAMTHAKGTAWSMSPSGVEGDGSVIDLKTMAANIHPVPAAPPAA